MAKAKQQSFDLTALYPVRPAHIPWSQEESGAVTLEIENKGAANRIAQKLLKKPKISHIHLDEIGSFVWLHMDGKTNLSAIGKALEAQFGEKAQPTYERLSQFFRILEEYRFVEWRDAPPDETSSST